MQVLQWMPPCVTRKQSRDNGLSAAAALADIPAAEALGPVDQVNRTVGALARRGEVAAARRDAEDAAAIGDEAPAVAPGAGMEDLDLGVARGPVEALYLAAALRVVGV